MPRFTARRPIKPQSNPEASKALKLILSVLETQVGADDSPSPLLDSLVDDLGLDEASVEVAQDATLLAVDIGNLIREAVETGDAVSLARKLPALLPQHIPEIAADIEAIKKN